MLDVFLYWLLSRLCVSSEFLDAVMWIEVGLL